MTRGHCRAGGFGRSASTCRPRWSPPPSRALADVAYASAVVGTGTDLAAVRRCELRRLLLVHRLPARYPIRPSTCGYVVEMATVLRPGGVGGVPGERACRSGHRGVEPTRRQRSACSDVLAQRRAVAPRRVARAAVAGIGASAASTTCSLPSTACGLRLEATSGDGTQFCMVHVRSPRPQAGAADAGLLEHGGIHADLAPGGVRDALALAVLGGGVDEVLLERAEVDRLRLRRQLGLQVDAAPGSAAARVSGSASAASARCRPAASSMDSGVRLRPRLGLWASSASRYRRTARPCSRPRRAPPCAHRTSAVFGPASSSDRHLLSIGKHHWHDHPQRRPSARAHRCMSGRRIRVSVRRDQRARPPRARPDRRRAAAIERDPRPGAEPPRAGDVRGHVVASTARTSRRRIHLRRLPTEAPWVLVGPGEGAGVIDVGDGIAVAIRIESHNHPSAIEPYQGAATGVGGILRDIFTMGARPIAVMDPLRFGPLDDARSRWIAEGVGQRHLRLRQLGRRADRRRRGRVRRDATPTTRSSTCSASACCRSTGWCSAGRRASATSPCCSGSSTGRDGIGGVSVLASAGFGDDEADAAKRPSVQVGDPFEEKRLIEACLDAARRRPRRRHPGPRRRRAHLRDERDGVARAASGMDVDVDRGAPTRAGHGAVRGDDQREPGADAGHRHARATSTRCSRSAPAVGGPGHRSSARSPAAGRAAHPRPARTARCWPTCPAASLARGRAAATTGRCAAPADRAAPPRRRPGPAARAGRLRRRPARPARRHVVGVPPVRPPAVPQHGRGPGRRRRRPAAKHPTTGVDTGRGLALTTDGNHRWCALDPRPGTALVVAESALNLACVGARPLALVNCLNFGNPEHPEVMWQLSEAIDGMADACRALGIPVVGGNVSLYNESRGRDIDPTPVVGVLGLDRRARPPRRPAPARRRRRSVVLLGGAGGRAAGRVAVGLGGARPPGRRAARRSTSTRTRGLLDLVRELVADGLVAGVHDVADGGLGVALAEMAVRSGVGAHVAGVDGPRRAVLRGPVAVGRLHRRRATRPACRPRPMRPACR